MKHTQTTYPIMTVWASATAGLALICAVQTVTAADGYPSGYQIIPRKAVKRPAPTRQKRAFRPITPVRVNSQATAQTVSISSPATAEPLYADTILTSAPIAPPTIPAFDPYPTPPQTTTSENSVTEPDPATLDWGYTDSMTQASASTSTLTVSVPPLVEENKPTPKTTVKPTPKKPSYSSSSRTRYSSRSSSSSGRS